MGIFTGKTHEDYYKWYTSKGNNKIKVKEFSLDIAKAMVYATAIEWLDSVEIFISIKYCELSKGFDYRLKAKIADYAGGNYKTRTEAIEEVLKKANELYNNLNK